MKSRLIYLLLITFMLPLAFAVKAQSSHKYQSMAMYIAAEDVSAIQPEQEKAAARLFQQKFAEFGTILTPKDIDKIKYPDFDCLWINIDSIGKSQGVEKFRGAFISDKFLQAVKKFHDDGGNLYMSKFAIELLYQDGLGILADYLRPNIFESGDGATNSDIWSINAEIGAREKENDPLGQYADRRSHPIYQGLTTLSSTEWTVTPDSKYASPLYRVFPMQGNRDKQPIHRENHNCMWRLAMKTDSNAKIGIYVGYEGVHNFNEIDRIENPQERAAAAFLLDPDGYFRQLRPNVNVEVICPGDIARIDPNNFDCIWIHIDRCGLEQGWDKLPEPFRRDDLIAALKEYSRNGGQLLLTKYATQLVVPIGRVPADFTPNIFGSGEGAVGTDDWQINTQLGWDYRDSDPLNYFDRSGYDIYRDIPAVTAAAGMTTLPMEGTGDGSPMWREDHNCIWDLNNLPAYKGNGELAGKHIARFQDDLNARVLGTWGHVSDDAVAGIVEFRPTIQYRGRIIANGLATCEWAPREGVNAYHHNLEMLTFNCLRYLVTVTDFKFVSDGPNGVSRFEQDANATVLGTWGQDWNHQAAGIVEFHPSNTADAVADVTTELDELNKNKAPKGTIIANGIGCVQLYHANGDNDFQDNTNRLTTNIIDYLSPWHSKPVSGVEEVSGSLTGSVKATGEGIRWEGFSIPTLLEVYGADGRLLESLTIVGDGSKNLDYDGLVIISAGGTVTKLVRR